MQSIDNVVGSHGTNVVPDVVWLGDNHRDGRNLSCNSCAHGSHRRAVIRRTAVTASSDEESSRIFARTMHPAYAIPLLLAVWSGWVALAHHRVPPFVDQWIFLGDYQRLLRDGWSLHWLFAAQNEHRIATSPAFCSAVKYSN